jgi:hypothetical protein
VYKIYWSRLSVQLLWCVSMTSSSELTCTRKSFVLKRPSHTHHCEAIIFVCLLRVLNITCNRCQRRMSKNTNKPSSYHTGGTLLEPNHRQKNWVHEVSAWLLLVSFGAIDTVPGSPACTTDPLLSLILGCRTIDTKTKRAQHEHKAMAATQMEFPVRARVPVRAKELWHECRRSQCRSGRNAKGIL